LRLGGLKIRQVLLESSFVLLFALATTAMHFWSHPGEGVEGGGILGYGGAYCIKLFAAFLSGRLFYASTRISEIRDSVTRILRRVPFVRRFDAGMALSLVLSYVPLIFEEWRYCLEAARARGMPRLPRPNQASAFLGSFLRRLMLKAVALPEALYARGWCLDRGLVPFRWRKRDSICLATAAILFAGAALHVV
jgi:energy-coupling factor transporter transmembrane protein EcfT